MLARRHKPSYRKEEWGGEVRVDVNQRALVDKVLARYSGEFTLFRELLQNADDAGSETAEIHFETAHYQSRAMKGKYNHLPPTPDLKLTSVVQWTFRNNGKEFDPEDWERLPRIAEGNPNPEKIGGFGVGFYSLFSVTNNPCVSSGEKEMEFYWENGGNQLHARRRMLPQRDQWTTFKMPLREPGPILRVLDLMRFLTSSITFMVKLRNVGIFVDSTPIGNVKKLLESPQTISIPSEMKRSSPEDVMCVSEVQSHRVTIDAEIKNAACATEAEKSSSSATSTFQVELKIFTAEVKVTLDERLKRELWRCTKKEPPSKLKYSLIYTGNDTRDRSFMELQKCHPEVISIFRGLGADLEGREHARIFIGHATGQSTGIGGHMASRFIPTVERESIDFVEKYVSIWNKELLYVGGFLCRLVYELELSDVQRLWEAAVAGITGSTHLSRFPGDLYQRFVHVLEFFAFYDSTPSPEVAQILRESFFGCSTSSLRLLSSVGVRAAPNIRAFDPQVTKFLESIPMISEYVSQEASHSIKGLPCPHNILPVTVEDVLRALHGHPLNEGNLALCLQWWLSLRQTDPSLHAAGLLSAVTFLDAGGTLRPLSQTEYFINIKGLGAHIPRDGPLPASLIPFGVSTHFTPSDLTEFGWRELTIMDWFQYISDVDVRLGDPIHDFTQSFDWAQHVLYVLSRALSSLSDEKCSAVKAIFGNTCCIPTSQGLCGPDNSYLPAASDVLFHRFRLPVITFTTFKLDSEIRTLLSFIGIQTHIPLQLLSDEMLDSGEWSISDLVDYLVRLPSPLTPQEIFGLRSSRLFSQEHSRDNAGEKSRCCANELYPPVGIFRRLRLPVIHWDKKLKWSDGSDEAKLLYRLGLNHYPPLDKILELCASPESSVGETAFTYFCDNLQSQYSDYDPKKYHDVKFVPAENKDGICLGSPSDVFLGSQWKMLGFSILRNACQTVVTSELGIQQHPPPFKLLGLLETRPPSSREARAWYECLSDCIQTFTQSEVAKLSELKIVPTGSDSNEWLTPVQCYLDPPADEFYSKLFVFVDFGRKANHFLSMCGSMKSPSVRDIAESLARDPGRFSQLAGMHEGFLERLRGLAVQIDYIPNETLNKMSRRRTLLGQRREKTGDQIGWKVVYDLRLPKEVVIVDDPRDYALFDDAIFVAPQDEVLERFYNSIGCRRLSTVIEGQYEDSPTVTDSETCTKVQSLILRRLPSFLQKCSHYQYDQTRVPRADNFTVAVFERLLVRKTLIVGNDNKAREQDLWATINHSEDGRIELRLSHHVKQDVYDLAASLCWLLFGTVKANDTLLLGAMLSDLELLKRAGFEVDQLVEQESTEVFADMLAEGGEVTVEDPSYSAADVTIDQGSPSQQVPGFIRQLTTDNPNDIRDAYLMVKRRPVSSSRTLNTFKYTNIPGQVMPPNYIRDVVSKATEACSSGNTYLLDDKDDVVEFLRHQSCSDFAQINNLRSLGITPQGVEVHVIGGDSDICAFIAGKQELLARFIHVVTPAAAAHKLPMGSLHIFYDSGTGPIAFNLKGKIFLNLRYFEEWHDMDVNNGPLQRAQLSWFFALAHEIAHNLIPLHDAAHEFWFSAICEAHIGDLLTAIPSDPSPFAMLVGKYFAEFKRLGTLQQLVTDAVGKLWR